MTITNTANGSSVSLAFPELLIAIGVLAGLLVFLVFMIRRERKDASDKR